MKWLLVLLALSTGMDCETVCRNRRWRCEKKCAEVHQVGSLDHLQCNSECAEEFLTCRKERCGKG